ncbi:MAG: hypothetical protein LJE95_15100 [Acidobacteria bacterium]|jgi:hypothetical protein|nr:hypothetical protein [Acidobacteriota bacterium]
MGRIPKSDGSLPQRGGCVRVGVGSLLLLVLAPPAALVRWWRRQRRGHQLRIVRRDLGGTTFSRIELTVDAPLSRELEVRAALIDALVRLAEGVRLPDDVYHLVFRRSIETEADLVGIGPQPQELAQRLGIAFSHRASTGRTQLWLTLPRTVHLSEVVDPIVFDPERPGASEDLVLQARPRWAMVSVFARSGPSVVYRLRLHLPPSAVGTVDAVMTRLSASLSAG